jgi:hypothetical protein
MFRISSTALHVLTMCMQYMWPSQSPNDLKALQAAATAMGSSTTWLPTFGCALLALGPAPDDQDVSYPLGQINLLLVALDDWKCKLHAR